MLFIKRFTKIFTKTKEKCLLLFMSMMPITAIAHPGHDHQSQWANLIHLLWIAPAIVAAYFLIKGCKNKTLNTKK